MRKKLSTLILTIFAFLSIETNAEEVKTSITINFESDITKANFDQYVKNGYGIKLQTLDLADNPVAFDSKQINRSETSLYYIAPTDGGDDIKAYQGPAVILPTPVYIDPMKPETHFLHIQILLPNGADRLAGQGCNINAYNHTNVIDETSGPEHPAAPRFITDGNTTPGSRVDYDKDYRNEWVEVDFDLRPYFGNTLQMLQIQADRGGYKPLEAYIDNITIDNRRKNFSEYDFGTVEEVDEGDCYIFLTGTPFLLMANGDFEDLKDAKYFPVALQKYEENVPEGIEIRRKWGTYYDDKIKNSLSDKSLELTLYGRYYLKSDGKVYPFDTAEPLDQYWVATKMEGNKGLNVINALTCTWVFSEERMEDLSFRKTMTDTIQFSFVKPDEVDKYMAEIASDPAEPVKTQVPGGETYYIFLAGTDYCMEDPRPMVWQGPGDKVEGARMYIPQDSYYSIQLRRYKEGNEAQKWTIRDYSDDILTGFEHSFFKRGNASTTPGGYRPFVSEKWHYSYGDDSTRISGDRLICGQKWNPECIIDTLGVGNEESFTFDFWPVFGDNATMINDDNNQQWFLKRLPYDENGNVAIYRPRNGVQGTTVKDRYDGATIYAAGNDYVLSAEKEKSYYVWKFINVEEEINPADLIHPDTVFGYREALADGDYYIYYRGSDQVATTYPVYGEDEITITGYRVKFEAKDETKEAQQLWKVTNVADQSKETDLFQITQGDNYLYSQLSNSLTKVGTAIDVQNDGLELENDATFFIIDGGERGYRPYTETGAKAYSLVSNPSSRAYHRVTGLSSVSTNKDPGGNLFQFVKSDAVPEVVNPLPVAQKVEPGFYYIQAAYSYNGEDPTEQYVLTSREGGAALNYKLTIEPYNADLDEAKVQQWYILTNDTVALDENDLDNAGTTYVIFDGYVADSLLHKDMLTNNELIRNDAFIISDRVQLKNGDVPTRWSWWAFDFLDADMDGKLAIKEHYHFAGTFIADGVTAEESGEGFLEENPMYKLADGANGQNEFRSGGNVYIMENKERAFMWYLIPANGELKPVTQYAPWISGNPHQINDKDDVDAFKANVSVEGNVITITEAEGSMISVTTVEGLVLKQIASAKATEKVSVGAAGVYIISVDSKAMKVAVK